MKTGQLITRPLRKNFYAAVMIIAYPSGNAQDVRLPFDEPPEADALDPSANEEAAGMDRLFRRTHGNENALWWP